MRTWKSRGSALAILTVCLGGGWASGVAQYTRSPAQLAHSLFRMINAARADRTYREETGGHAAPLRWDAAVARVALRHSEEMAREHRLSHTDVNGRTPAARMSEAGIAWTMVAENVAMAPSIEAANRMMMSEPSFQTNHRGNILDRRLNVVGIGVVASGDELWVTEDFLRPAAIGRAAR